MLMVGARYLVMAASSYGVSAFQRPPMDVSPTDPWFLLGLIVLAGLGLRWILCLRARNPEAIHWTFALASFAPVSQIIPFPYPVADHYLYAILPGLIGATSLSLLGPLDRLESRVAATSPGRAAATRLRARLGAHAPGPVRALAALAVLLGCMGFALHAHQRAALWRSGYAISLDAAHHYPDGVEAHLIAAFRLAQVGNAPACAASLRRAFERGYRSFGLILQNPVYARVRTHPDFDAVIRDMAGWWILRAAEVDDPTQRQLQTYAHAYAVRGELDESIRLLELALEIGGPGDDSILVTLDRQKLARRIRERSR
jgi:hypothetical protein